MFSQSFLLKHFIIVIKSVILKVLLCQIHYVLFNLLASKVEFENTYAMSSSEWLRVTMVSFVKNRRDC